MAIRLMSAGVAGAALSTVGGMREFRSKMMSKLPDRVDRQPGEVRKVRGAGLVLMVLKPQIGHAI